MRGRGAVAVDGFAAWVALATITLWIGACGRVPLDAAGDLADGGADAPSANGGPSDAQSGSAACGLDGGIPAYASAVAGDIEGPDIGGSVCPGGALAYLEGTRYGAMVVITNSYTGDPSSRFDFQKPADAATAEFGLLTIIGAPAPGTYTGAQTCGSVVFCAVLPIPASLNCDAAGISCPPGCALEGPISAPTCTPVAPEICYTAYAATDCLGDSQTVQGSWTLTLTSVEPYASSPDPNLPDSIVHGTLNANLIGGEMYAGTEPATLSLTF